MAGYLGQSCADGPQTPKHLVSKVRVHQPTLLGTCTRNDQGNKGRIEGRYGYAAHDNLLAECFDSSLRPVLRRNPVSRNLKTSLLPNTRLGNLDKTT